MYNVVTIFKKDTLIGYSLNYKCNYDFILDDEKGCKIYNYTFCRECDYLNFINFVSTSINCIRINL